MYYSMHYRSPIGDLFLVSNGTALVGLWLEGQKYFGGKLPAAIPDSDLPVFATAADWLDRYFRGDRPDPAELPLAPQGTKFQQRVWQELLKIPYGSTTTYGEIARTVGKPRACQAVGGAVGHNPISIIIPCHRVVGAKGQLTGFAGGLDKKTWLLRHEAENHYNY